MSMEIPLVDGKSVKGFAAMFETTTVTDLANFQQEKLWPFFGLHSRYIPGNSVCIKTLQTHVCVYVMCS